MPHGGERQHEHLVPVVVGQPLARAVDRVHRLTLVELKAPLAVGALGDPRVLVLGLAVPDHTRVAGGLDGADRDRQQQRHPHRRQDEAPLQGRDGDHGERQGEGQERPPRPHQRDEQERAEEGAHQRADGRDRVEASGHAAGLLDRAHAQAHRVGRNGAEQHDRDGDEHEHADERADERARLNAVQRLDGDAQEGLGHEGHERQQRGGAQHHAAEAGDGRIAVGQAPSDPVADAQRDEHRGDRVGPHDRGGSEPRGQEPRGGDLGAERRGADDGGEDLDAAPRHVAETTTGASAPSRGAHRRSPVSSATGSSLRAR